MNPSEQRIMRIPLPVPLIREMDAVILKGLGGYATRAEFIVDAIQERVLELSIDAVEDAGAPPPPASPDTEASIEKSVTTQQEHATATPSMTALTAPLTGPTVDPAVDLSRPEGRALFGLHNRDYPSLWALAHLAKMTADGPVPVESFYVEALRAAWRFGELLLGIEKRVGTKCTALFPTNPEKRKPAEMGFRSFAVGDYRAAGDTYTTSGPLFEWHLAGLVESDNGPLIGVTSHGWKILQAVTGVSVEEPHPAPVAEDFLAHLAEHAPADRRGFIEIVSAIGADGAARQAVLDHVTKAWPDWTENEVSTNSAGYIARAREWGLVEPKQTKSRYHLTDLGHEHLANGVEQ